MSVEYIDRESLFDIENYKVIFEKEKHYHKIVKINDIIRWEEHPGKTEFIKEKGLNHCVNQMILLGLNKNSEEWRALYRNLGYSLSGYWEVFYWEWNNPIAEEYNYNENSIIKKVGYINNNIYNSSVVYEVYEEKETAKFYFGATKVNETTDYACFVVYDRKIFRDKEFLSYEQAKQYYDSI